MERDDRRVHAHPDDEEEGRDPGFCEADGKRSGRLVLARDPGEEEGPAEDVQESVPVPGAFCLRPTLPDEDERGEREDLPEDEDRDEVPGEDHAHRRPYLDEDGSLLDGPGQVTGVDDSKDADRGKDDPDHVREAVDRKQGECCPGEERQCPPGCPGREPNSDREPGHGDREDGREPEPGRDEGEEECSREVDQRRGNSDQSGATSPRRVGIPGDLLVSVRVGLVMAW